jgi:serine acetyltransferase
MVTCVYRAYENGELVATGRLTLERLPRVGDEVQLNGRAHVVRSVEFGDGEHVLELGPR